MQEETFGREGAAVTGVSFPEGDPFVLKTSAGGAFLYICLAGSGSARSSHACAIRFLFSGILVSKHDQGPLADFDVKSSGAEKAIVSASSRL